jgi:hypothetical protein
MKFGMTEHKVSEILKSEFESLGMPDGEGLVLFGGEPGCKQLSALQ